MQGQPGRKGSGVTQGEAIRRSGVALEFATSRMLETIEPRMLPKGRYTYETGEMTPEGNEKHFEADIYALGGDTVGCNSFEHAWFIECKRRRDLEGSKGKMKGSENEQAKAWCFFSPPPNVKEISQNTFLVDILADRDGLKPYKLRSLKHRFYPASARVVGDGIELLEKKGSWEANTQTIANAVRQTIMPIGHHFRWPLHRNLLLDYEGQVLELYLPIVVTTAGLYALRENVSDDELNRFDQIDDCFDPVNAVTSVFTTPAYVQRYWERMARSYMENIYREKPDVFITNPYFTSLHKTEDITGIPHIVDAVTTNMPTRALIVRADAAREVLSSYLREVNEAILVAFRS